MAKPWEQDEIVKGPWDADEVVATATAAAAPQPQESFARKAGRILLPATQAFTDEHGADASVGKYGALAKDVVSAPRRVFGAGVELVKGNPAGARQEMEAKEGTGILNTITREAPLMFVPGGQVRGAGLAKRIGSAVAEGAKESIASTAYHQAERVSEGKGLSAGEAAGELATGGMLRGAFQGIAEGAKRIIPYVKTGISKLSEVSQEALTEATDPVGGQGALERFKEAGKRFGTDDGVNVMPIAEDLGEKVKGANAQRINLAEGSRAQQLEQFEGDLTSLRRDATGGKATRIGGISPTAQGDAIQRSLTDAKEPLQMRFVEGDKAAYQGLRDAPVPSEQALPARFDDILSQHKALDPEQGVPNISPAMQKAITGLRGLGTRAKTVDDLTNLKGQIRGLQLAGGFEGALFDKTRDDRALAMVLEAVHDVEKEAIRKAAPKKAAQIITLVDANNALYGRTLEALRKGEQRFGKAKTQGIVSKIKDMDLREIQALKKEAEANDVLAPYVHELQNGFVDDLLLSASKDGQVSPKAFAKEWADLSPELKTAWLRPEWITRIDNAIAKGTAEIKDPEKVGKVLFGNAGDVFQAERKISNIDSEAQKKALSEMQMLDALFGSDFTQDALAAYRAKQLQIDKGGKLPLMGNIRTGKAMSAAAAGAATGAGAGSALAGPLGAAAGSAVGSAAGFYLQSPAGALAIFRILNRLERGGPARETAKKVLSQGARSGIFGEDDQ